jgi:hypothetical protein
MWEPAAMTEAAEAVRKEEMHFLKASQLLSMP